MNRDSRSSSPKVRSPQRGGPRSVTRILNVLKVLATKPEGLSLAELSTTTGTPKTSLLALLRGLAEFDYIEQRDARYRLGQESFALGSSIVAHRSFPRVARAILERLAQESGETILVAELSADRTQAVYTEKLEGTRAVRFIANVGETRPLYASAGGRVLLAFQNAEFRNAYLDSTSLKPLNRKKAITRAGLRKLLENVRQNGLATTREDVSEGVAGFAAPIFGQGGALLSALVIGTPIARGDRDAGLLSNLVKVAAARISRALGHDHAPQHRADSPA